LDREECRVIGQALNEVCNAIALPEFHARLGATRDSVVCLHEGFHVLWNRMMKEA